MNYIDLGVLAILAISALLGLSRGLVREMLGLGAWVLAGWGAWHFGPAAIPATEKLIGNPDIAEPVAYAGVFLVLLIGLSLLSNLIGRIVSGSALGGLDHTLGLVFGLARGAAVLIAAYIPLSLIPMQKWPAAVRTSLSLPYIYDGADWAARQMPRAYRPNVVAPPDGRTATEADLLHASPSGSALAPAAPRPQVQ